MSLHNHNAQDRLYWGRLALRRGVQRHDLRKRLAERLQAGLIEISMAFHLGLFDVLKIKELDFGDVVDGAAWRIDDGHFIDVDGIVELGRTLASHVTDEDDRATRVGVHVR